MEQALTARLDGGTGVSGQRQLTVRVVGFWAWLVLGIYIAIAIAVILAQVVLYTKWEVVDGSLQGTLVGMGDTIYALVVVGILVLLAGGVAVLMAAIREFALDVRP